MAGQQAQSGASDWFASWFGQCCKGPPVEGELNFEAESKTNAGKDSQVPSTPTGARMMSGSTVRRYLIDNSALQSQTRPGVAFRHSKEHSKKVKDMKAVPWGEQVDGIDQGDGWLKVGAYYLPMTHQGKPIITLVRDTGLPCEAKLEKATNEHCMDRKPATPQGRSSRQPQSPNGSPSTASAVVSTSPPRAVVQDISASLKRDSVDEAKQLVAPEGCSSRQPQSPNGSPSAVSAVASTSPPKAVAQDIAASLNSGCAAEAQQLVALEAQDVIAEAEAPAALAQQESASSPKGESFVEPEKPAAYCPEEKASSLENGIVFEDVLSKPAGRPARAWFLQPSVGTWLHALPQAVVENAEPAIVQEAERAIPQGVSPHVEAQPATWQHQPSVATWIRGCPVGIAARSNVAEMKSEEPEQLQSTR